MPGAAVAADTGSAQTAGVVDYAFRSGLWRIRVRAQIAATRIGRDAVPELGEGGSRVDAPRTRVALPAG